MPPKNVQLDVDEDVQEADCPHCTDSARETYRPIHSTKEYYIKFPHTDITLNKDCLYMQNVRGHSKM